MEHLKRYNTHCHIINEQIYPWSIFVNRLKIPKFMVKGVAEVLKGSPTATKALENTIELIGDDPSIHLVEILHTFTSNFSECVDLFLNNMDAAGIDVATPLMIDLTANHEIEHPDLSWELQVKLFGELHKRTDGKLRPFYGFDPRRSDSLDTAINEIDAGRFFGIKLYPPMGFDPSHVSGVNSKIINARLRQLYSYCEHYCVPITSHDSPGGVRGFGVTPERAKFYSHPERLWDVFFDFPELIFSFAHAGGNCQFVDYFLHKTENRMATIYSMMLEFEYKYATVAYHGSAMATDKHRRLKKDAINYGHALRLAMGDMPVTDSLLYGDDSIVSLFEFTPEEGTSAFRQHLPGNHDWDLLTSVNPESYLLQLLT